ncbi:hypothetical protein L2E82_14101 [Cichorium intybus]|uniref:Uncharacterized protein n=1 Tax=Cichorium intybus TaxID=13427 RepID=A0ACB9EZN4_CICIN|nr:hypothetical protein L2E82_14101 [Cichorium intybus]
MQCRRRQPKEAITMKLNPKQTLRVDVIVEKNRRFQRLAIDKMYLKLEDVENEMTSYKTNIDKADKEMDVHTSTTDVDL